MKVTSNDVTEVIGELDEFTLEKILAIGATRAELHEGALAAVLNYEMGQHIPRHSERVDAVRAIVERLLFDEEGDDTTRPPYPFSVADEEAEPR